MGLNKANTTIFHRTLYAGEMETITLLKRGNDAQESVITAYKLFDCRRSPIPRTGEPIFKEEGSLSQTVWHIPRIELTRVGVKFLNVLDIIIDTAEGYPRHWTPEANSQILLKMFSNWYTFTAVQVNPPNAY